MLNKAASPHAKQRREDGARPSQTRLKLSYCRRLFLSVIGLRRIPFALTHR